MTATIVGPHVEQVLGPEQMDGAEWLAARRHGIGGSDVAAILGISKYDGPLCVYAEKVHGYSKPKTDAMDLGSFLEPWVVGKFTARHPELHVTAKPGMFRGAQSWHLASPDAVAAPATSVAPTDLVEAKTASRWGEDAEEGWGEAGTDEVPFNYLCQVTWTCRVVGLTRWHIPVLFLDGREYREYRGVYSPDLGDQVAARIDQWWATHILAQVEPRADHFESTRLLLNYRHAAPAKSKGQLPDDARTWAAEYLDLRDQRAEIESAMAERANLLRQAHVAARCEIGLVGDQPISTLSTTATGSKRLNVKESAR